MAHTQVTVLNPDGREREYSIEKSLFFIGSNPGNDIVVGSINEGVDPRHIQVIVLGNANYRLVNLGETVVTLSNGRDISPRASLNLAVEDQIKLKGYTISLTQAVASEARVGFATQPEAVLEQEEEETGKYRSSRSKAIGLSISLEQTLLSLDEPIEGMVTVQNLGNQPGVQFLLELEGLEPGTYELGAGPILFPNAQKSTFLNISHPKKPFPVAGDHRFTIRASAPDDYPGESVVVAYTIHILPFYKHKLRVLVSD